MVASHAKETNDPKSHWNRIGRAKSGAGPPQAPPRVVQPPPLPKAVQPLPWRVGGNGPQAPPPKNLAPPPPPLPPPEAPPPQDLFSWCEEQRAGLLKRMGHLMTEMVDAREKDEEAASVLPTVLKNLMKSTGETADPGQAMVEAPGSGNVDEDRVAKKRRRDEDEELEEAVEAPGSGNVDEDKVAKKRHRLKPGRFRRKKRFRDEAEELEEAMRVSKKQWQPEQEAVATGSAGASSSKDNEVAL